MPTLNVVCVPKMREQVVARGETSKAIEMERPPTKANSREDAPGNMFTER
jgi:hypothetical protein